MNYEKTLEHLKRIKDKYSSQILAVRGVHGIGIRVSDYRIVVYVDEMSADIIKNIPLFLEEVPVEITMQEMITPTFSGGDRAFTDTSWGTFGSIWFSTRHKRMVGVSNNHVFADADKGIIRSTSIPITMNVTNRYGGVPSVEESSYWGNDFKDYPVTVGGTEIHAIRTWDSGQEMWVETSEIGRHEYVLLNGQNFGLEQLGENRLLLNGNRTPYLFWGGTELLFIMPSDTPDSVEISITAQGQVKKVEDRKNGYKAVEIGEMIDYAKIFFEQDVEGNWYTEANGDVAICTIAGDFINEAEHSLDERGSYYTADRLYNWVQTGRRHTLTGLVTTPIKEFMPLMGSGARGTYYMHVVDPSYDCLTAYNPANATVRDTVYYKYTEIVDGASSPFPPCPSGNSGTSVLIADIDQLIEFYNYFGIVPPTRIQMENALKDEQGNQIAFTDNFVGNHFAGNGTTVGVCDKGSNWYMRMGVLPISMVPEIDAENAPIQANSGMLATANLVSTAPIVDIEVSASFSSATGISGIVSLVGIIQPLFVSAEIKAISSFGAMPYMELLEQFTMELPFDLVQVQTVNFYEINFDLQPTNLLEFTSSASFTGTSSFQAIGDIISVLLANADFQGTSSFIATGEVIGYFLSSADFQGTSSFIATGEIIGDFSASADFQGASSFIATGEVIGDFLASTFFTGTSSFQARGIIAGTEFIQYEEIHFTIAHSQNINSKITRSLNINSEITRSIDLSLAI